MSIHIWCPSTGKAWSINIDGGVNKKTQLSGDQKKPVGFMPHRSTNQQRYSLMGLAFFSLKHLINSSAGLVVNISLHW